MLNEFEEIAKPIFDALIRNNASPELIKKVFFEIEMPECFAYLPKILKFEPNFLQECLKRDLMNISEIPEHLRNNQFITKETYLLSVERYHKEIENNIYPQDEEIVLAAIRGNSLAYVHVNEEFKNNKSLMMKCILANVEILGFIKEDIREEFFKNDKLVMEILEKNPDMFHHMSEEKKYDAETLKSVLKNDRGYSVAKNYLKNTKDPEVALMALKVSSGARKNIHQMYRTILKRNKVSENCYNFLKIYLEKKN